MKHNPRYDDIFKAIAEHKDTLIVPWQGECWRFQAASYPTGKEILSGQGAYVNGGRWNAAGTTQVVYGSTSEEVALKEA
ncbi:MAG: RES family NAD+ phosphorylase [Akkermansiaceae bacterium]|nr:RES family NAD+ phosphorylase [Akkermansiaceae bacterium]